VGYDNIKMLKPGDYIYLNGEYKAQIVDIQRYLTFRDAVNENNFKLLVPNASSVKEVVELYEMLFPLWKQRQFGAYILKIKYPTNR